ncbi:TraB/GumN family protein [Sediminibacterium soli]|uniref:TraB/GumN family protein n=1 Tax=Sediminibacterium soli TaxID=2698829 RepID=UPI00137970E2|nr:TraB/GumN family protein [Sediminibacterium soli]NCI46988.1 TraB/GumN family protein [Sediminibacterium soli]
MKKTSTLLAMLLLVLFGRTQNSPSAYPSLLWEITGNGLTRPSYLFGTMHVSNKMAFHLSDSFYHAIASCSTVSLELDPKQWQSEMFRLQQSQTAMVLYQRVPSDYINERSFRLNSRYAADIKRALSEEPYVINGLLYRTADGQSNFQENTYLDLYVYQTARKLGKKATGVENYMESERIQLEAREDMMRARNRIRVNFNNENPYEIQRRIQEAYRRGDLSMLDSLSQLTGSNEAFNEKFLYGRNDIQANSIDSIIRKESLFVAVGAAHLPGKRGVIELLRRKGYTLRPVNMTDRDAEQRDRIDKIRVPVQMQTVLSDDGLIELKVPGKLFRRTDISFSESWQYADMENGAYYMLSRIKTHPGQTAEAPQGIARKTDSLLYENIPGKILEKKNISVNGYNGISIINKTRRGDIQRYAIIYTAQEVLVFKMSGNDDYVYGKEADDFFGSIRLQQPAAIQWANFSPAWGGFTIAMPQKPAISPGTGEDFRSGSLYEAVDASNGDAYMVMQKHIHNHGFIEEDTFDISLIAESLKSSEAIDKELSRKFGKQDGVDALDMVFSLKDGGVLKARAFIKGAQYYLLTARGHNPRAGFNRFFSSFHTNEWKYPAPQLYTDPSLGFTVTTPVQPAIDKDLKEFLNKQLYGTLSILLNERYQAHAFPRNAYFKSDSTGEAVQVTVSTFAKYYSQKDTAAFWNAEMDWKKIQTNFVIDSKTFETGADASLVCRYVLSDTNTSRRIKGLAILSGNKLYRVQALVDNNSRESSFIGTFFSSFQPIRDTAAATLFSSRSAQLLEDIQSGDSSVQKFARSAVGLVGFAGSDIAGLKKAFDGIKPDSRDYLSTKTKLVLAAGQIKDTLQYQQRLDWLRDIYDRYADTSMYQNAALQAIAGSKTTAAYAVLKKILVENPPVFDNSFEYQTLFRTISDSLSLAAGLYPDILQLTAFDDYKQPVITLLAKLVDSSRLPAESYRTQFSKLFFDLQIQCKKLQALGEREMMRLQQAENEPGMGIYMGSYANGVPGSPANLLIGSYLVLVMPFYDENPQVAKLFARLLHGSDVSTKMQVALLLARNGKSLPDSAWMAIAENDQYRSALFERLDKLNKLSLFPAKFNTQEAISRSLAVNSRPYTRVVEIQPMGSQKVRAKNATGYLYFFKYRIQKQGDWLMAVNGLQPSDTTQVKIDRSMTNTGNKKLVTNGTEQEQFNKLARQLVMRKRKSALSFFEQERFGLTEEMF